MAHQIESDYAFFASNTPAWHKIGHVLKDAPTIEQACTLAANNHTYHKCDITITGTDINIQSAKMIMRDDGKEIGHVGEDYELIQPAEMFQRFKPLLDSNLVKLEAGGLLNEGKRIWALGKVIGSDTEIIKNDVVKQYVLFSGSFDGSLSDSSQFTGVRVVCANTLAMARRDKNQKYAFKHTKNIRDKIKDVVSNLKESISQFQATTQAMQLMARTKLDRKLQESYIKTVFEYNESEPEKNSPQLDVKVSQVIELLDNQKGLELVPAIRGTTWQAYNAISEYVTHQYGRNDDSRVNAQYFGVTKTLNERAFDLALQVC